MNTRKLLVSIFILISVLFSACAPHSPDVLTGMATPAPTVIPPTTAPTAIPPIDTATPKGPASDPSALAAVAGTYYDSESMYTRTPLDLLLDGNYYYEPDGDIQVGTYTVSPEQITFTEKIGVCGNVPGIYKWSLQEDAFKLTVVDDKCLSRTYLMITPLKKLLKQEPYVDLVWKISTPELMYVSVDTQGNIYTTTGQPGGFSKYDPTGKLIQNWPLQIRWAEGIALDAQGNIYMGNWDKAQIQKFDGSGNLLTSWKVSGASRGPVGPVGMRMDAQENLYVVLGADGGTVDHYIEKYDPQGKLLGHWANSGSGEGEIKPTNGGSGIRLTSLAVDPEGNTYLADPQQNRVNKYDPSGKFLYSLMGDGENNFWHSWYVSLDSQQNVYVMDQTHIIWKFDRDGKFIGKWRTLLMGEMAFAKDGNLLIANRAGFLSEVTLPTP